MAEHQLTNPPQARVATYAPAASGAATATNTTVTRELDAATTRNVDLVRWGPIVAGLFAALATLATLSVLGLAVGLAAFKPGDNLANYGLSAGIWGAISALIAFGVGGWLAARSAAVSGHSNGILNGAMVWFVTIPLLLFLLGNGLGALVGTAGSAVGTVVQSAAPIAGQVATDPAAQATAQAGGQQVAAGVQLTAQAVVNNISPDAAQKATDAARNTAWSTLLSLGLAAAAAIAGGYLGSRPRPETTVQTTTVRT